MSGGTLMISRAVDWFPHIKRRLEELGFRNVSVTGEERDALVMAIRELKPDLVMMGAGFYQCATAYRMRELIKCFPGIYFAGVSIDGYPAELGMYFILNGARAFANAYDGPEHWYRGLKDIREGREYTSPEVQKRMDMRKEYPMAAWGITPRRLEVVRLICNGFRDIDMAETLQISMRTVENIKTEIYTALNVRNCNEVMRAALTLKLVKQEEIYFYPKDFVVNPMPDKALKKAVSMPPKTMRGK